MFACERGHKGIVKILMDKGAKCRIKNDVSADLLRV